MFGINSSDSGHRGFEPPPKHRKKNSDFCGELTEYSSTTPCRCHRGHHRDSIATNKSKQSTQALQFAVDQAPFACGAESPHPAPADINGSSSGNTSAWIDGSNGGDSSANAASAKVARREGAAAGGDSAGVRLAVRAGLQFACNFCVGSEENKALLWDAWFPRGLMVRPFTAANDFLLFRDFEKIKHVRTSLAVREREKGDVRIMSFL